jgi:hypothetical protein
VGWPVGTVDRRVERFSDTSPSVRAWHGPFDFELSRGVVLHICITEQI